MEPDLIFFFFFLFWSQTCSDASCAQGMFLIWAGRRGQAAHHKRVWMLAAPAPIHGFARRQMERKPQGGFFYNMSKRDALQTEPACVGTPKSALGGVFLLSSIAQHEGGFSAGCINAYSDVDSSFPASDGQNQGIPPGLGLHFVGSFAAREDFPHCEPSPASARWWRTS